MKENKSPGVDGISPKILKETVEQISTPLAHVFNMSLQEGIIPFEWKEANIIPLFNFFCIAFNINIKSDKTNVKQCRKDFRRGNYEEIRKSLALIDWNDKMNNNIMLEHFKRGAR